jgi:plasmid stabilization system protein ParE
VTRFSVEVLPEAEQEFREAFFWYFERSPTAADAFRSVVFEAINALEERADMWPTSQDGLHYCVLSRFPYTVWYDLHGAKASVLAIAHQHRRPEYWKNR